LSAADIHREPLKVYNTDVMSRQQVAKWHRNFASGWGNVTDENRREQRSSSTANVNNERAEELVQSVTYRRMASDVNVPNDVMRHIMVHVLTVLVCATGRLVL
jgi:hypothetical protein